MFGTRTRRWTGAEEAGAVRVGLDRGAAVWTGRGTFDFVVCGPRPRGAKL